MKMFQFGVKLTPCKNNRLLTFGSIVVLFLFTSAIYSQTNSQIFTTSSAFTVPIGVTQITVEAWGGGGRGGTRTSAGEGGGGGGGAYAKTNTITVIPGNTYTVTVGAGSTTISPGGDSGFDNNLLILAKGGNSVADNTATGANGGLASLSIGDVKYSGGNGSSVVSNNGGGGGSSAGTAVNGVNATTSTGATAPSGGGNGGNGATINNTDGLPGIAPGGGGGGGKRVGSSGNGGAGASGQVIITWTDAPLTNGPGGVTDKLQLWLRSDLLDGATPVADNTNVTTWKTQARASNATALSGKQPIYRNNGSSNINFNPVVDFNNVSTTQQYMTGVTGFYSHEMFVVIIPNVTINASTSRNSIFSGKAPSSSSTSDVTGVAYGDHTARFTNEVFTYALNDASKYGIADVTTNNNYNNVGIINARNNTSNPATNMELFYNASNVGNLEVYVPTFQNVINSEYLIGTNIATNISPNLRGRIAEIITYSSRKDNTTERPKIETYLAIKYGITLGVNGTSQNYVNADNVVIYAANAGYNFDIAGIGRDDVSKLYQKQSKSSNLTSLVTIGLGTIAATNTANTNIFATDKSYLVWGHNNASLVDAGTTFNKSIGASVTANYRMINRKWKIVETGGDVAEVEITIPTSVVSGFTKTATEEYVLVVSSTATFANADIIDLIPLKTVGSNLQTWYDFDGTQFFSIAKTEKITGSFQVNTASGDYLVSENNINLNPSAFTISAWIQNGNATGIRTIIAKGTDYEVRLNAAKVEVLWNGSSRITSTASVTDNKWHQIAVTFATGTAHLFIDGILDQTIASLPNPPSPTTAKFSIAARFNNKLTSTPFEGNIDEIRIWDSALTVNQLRYMMNQEIEKFTDDTVNGTILPQTITRNEVKTIPWANLKTYFNLNSIYGTAVEDQSNQRNFARIKYLSANKQIVNTQTAPLPYETSATGNWETAATWKNGGIQTLPNSSNINWNIVNLKHNVSATIGHTVLGLMNDALTKLTVQASDSLRVTHYLKLNGVIDLVGESQLVQDQGSILDATSLGTIERDQQGTGDNFKYNYWGSPVNITGTHYSIAGVLKDGTDVNNLKTIDFGTAWIYADGAVTSPIKLSTYWMYKFTNKLANDYYGWEGVGKDGLLKVGEGFTLKGSNTNLTEQNYTFTGKPNNGDITLTINSGREYLVGNPYPSSLNAKQFIRDNISTAAGGNRTSNIIDGNLYFWDHFGGGTHYLKSYEGGYAVFNLSGGVKAIANNTLINNTGNSSLTIPQRFIPVAQGFFVKADVGGDIQFKNSQRVFKKEQALTSIFIRNSAPSKSNKITSEDDFPRIYLNFSSPDGLHRQLLVGFIANTTDGIDIGYDGILNESNTSDMYWKAANTNLVIQAVPTLDNNRVLPIDVKVATAGTIKINVDGLENVPTETEIFIKDNLTGVKHLINTNPFEVNLTAGTYSSRFEVVFKTQGTLTVEENDALEQLLNIYVNNQQNKIHISKNQSVEIKEMVVYNMIGQQITSIKKVINEQVVEVPFNVQTGVYLIKVITNQGIISKKIIKQ